MTKKIAMRRWIYVALSAVFVTFAGLSTARADDRPDAWVTLKTKVSLMTTEHLSTKDLNVDTVKGVVTLHGMVASEAEKTRAQEVALKVDGVHAVKNLLQVVPTAKRNIVERSDADIKANVENAFKANRRVNESGIKVISVNRGVVLLGGKTSSMEAHAESVGVADAVKGVQRVSSEVVVE